MLPGRLPRLVVLVQMVLVTPLFAQNADAPANNVAVQLAMRQARDFLDKNRAADAVALLEGQLKKVSNSAAMLALLKDAYAVHVKDLELAGKVEAAEMYRGRMNVLEVKPASPAPVPIARGSRPEEDPFQQRPLSEGDSNLLRKAEEAFQRKQYVEAADLYGKASQVQPIPANNVPQFAYCRLSKVVSRLNEPAIDAGGLSQLELEVNSALKSVDNEAKLDQFGKQVLEEIKKRRGSTPSGFRHYDRSPEGWLRCDSANFHLFHMQSQEYAEQFLNLAEQHRKTAFQKWSGTVPGNWTAACDVIMHASGSEYARVTKQPARSPGHSSFKVEGNAVAARRMDLRADEPNVLGCTLPHELTHLVIADLVGDLVIPRWADEGMAVLSEPRSQMDRYGKTLQRLHNENALLPLEKMLRSPDFPEAAAITAFYVESVSVVEFLVNEKGPAAFLRFLREANQSIDPALQKHYNIRNVAELQQRWTRVAFGK